MEDIVLSEIVGEIFGGQNISGMTFGRNCAEYDMFDIIMQSSNVTQDTIHTREYPLNFDDQENHLKSALNYFVKE